MIVACGSELYVKLLRFFCLLNEFLVCRAPIIFSENQWRDAESLTVAGFLIYEIYRKMIFGTGADLVVKLPAPSSENIDSATNVNCNYSPISSVNINRRNIVGRELITFLFHK